ncbi:linear amide C-N hydrolase [Listeria sp. PSOL-1]|uniref:linear amide C-N hydrolase n=1 Tax=Listeria sp. PSOL-1 TaxID=1844999 RepID=UPI0013D77D02|nr:linear amide C-N hydrolase [Listeria sp. PSOL-1]
MLCSNITLKSQEGNMYWSRTLDNYFDPNTEIKSIPKNYEMKGQSATWKTKYAFLGASVPDTDLYFDGMNETGLIGGLFYLEECEWDSREKIIARDKTPLFGEEFVAWILSQYSTIDEIAEAVEKIALVDEKYLDTLQVASHYCFVDKDQRHIVLEPVKNGDFIIHKDTMGIMTNSPTYEWHLDNLRNYMELTDYNRSETKVIRGQEVEQIESGSGLQGLPGDYTSPSRFIRAAYLSEFVDTPTDKEAIIRLYNVTKSVMIAPGWEKVDHTSNTSDYNVYWSAYDQANLTIYVNPSDTNTFTKVKLDNTITEIKTLEISHENSYYVGK